MSGGYRDDREALRARLNDLEDKLARSKETIADLRGQRSARRWRRAKPALLIGALLVGATALGAAAFFMRPRPHPAAPTVRGASAATEATPVPFIPSLHAPMFASSGPIAWGTLENKGCLAAFDGRSGTRRWLTCPYSSRAADDARAVLIGGRVIVNSERDLAAFDVKSGDRLWTSRLDNRAFEFCLSADGTLRVSLEGDAETFLVNQDTGSPSPSTRVYDCQVLWHDGRWRSGALPGQHVATRGVDLRAAPDIAGMAAELTVRHGGRTVVTGHGKPGKHVPMAAAVPDGGAAPLWIKVLALENPPMADADGPHFVALDDSKLCAVYPGVEGDRLGCWDAASGKTRWDVPGTGPVGGLLGVALTDHEVIVQFLKGFSVFDATSGARLYDVH